MVTNFQGPIPGYTNSAFCFSIIHLHLHFKSTLFLVEKYDLIQFQVSYFRLSLWMTNSRRFTQYHDIEVGGKVGSRNVLFSHLLKLKILVGLLIRSFYYTGDCWGILPTQHLHNPWLLSALYHCWKWKWKSLSQVRPFLQPRELYSLWDFPGQNTGVGSPSLLQGIFPTQESNAGLPLCRWILYQPSYQGSPWYNYYHLKDPLHPCHSQMQKKTVTASSNLWKHM